MVHQPGPFGPERDVAKSTEWTGYEALFSENTMCVCHFWNKLSVLKQTGKGFTLQQWFLWMPTQLKTLQNDQQL